MLIILHYICSLHYVSRVYLLSTYHNLCPVGALKSSQRYHHTKLYMDWVYDSTFNSFIPIQLLSRLDQGIGPLVAVPVL